MVFLQLRITLPLEEEENSVFHANRVKAILIALKNHIINDIDPDALYSCGREKLNKYGEPCPEHFHFNISYVNDALSDPLRSIKTWIRKSYSDAGIELKGNKVWSCTMVEEPNDFLRWIRYPLKEHPIRCLCHISTTFPGYDKSPETLSAYNDILETAILLATEERKQAVEANIVHREKSREKQTLKDKLFKHLDDLNYGAIKDEKQASEHPSHQTIWEQIVHFYMELGKPICFRTLNGYTLLYQLHTGAITPSQAYVMSQKNSM